MADDVASLGLTVDSSGLDKGSEKLKQFSKDADGAAKSADGFNAKTSAGAKASTEQAAGYGKVTSAVAGMSEAQLGAATVIGALTVAAGAAAVAAGVLAYQWASAQNSITRSLIGIGATSGTTIAQINKFSTENATATGLSVDQARESAMEFAKTGDIAVGQLKGLGDAVYGFSILTGTNATKAAKTLAQALSGDLVKGAQELNKTYGFLNPAIEDNIRLLVNQGERTKAQQLILNAIAEDNKKAEDTVNGLTVAWNAAANAADAAYNAAKRFFGNGNRDTNLDNLRNSPETKTAAEQQLLANDAAEKSAARANSIQKSSDQIAMAADEVVKAYDPYIKKIQDADAALASLKAQQDRMNSEGGPVPGFAATFDDKGAGQAVENLRASLTDLEGQSQRYNGMVAQIAKAWGNVGQSTALSLQAMQNALPVAQAWTNSGRMLAQWQQTYNNEIDHAKTAVEATAIASKQEELSKAAAVASAQKMVQASEDNLAKLQAQGTEMEGVVASSIAYRDAIQAGASSTQAAAIAANTLAANMLQAAKNADQMTQAATDAVASAMNAAGGANNYWFGANSGTASRIPGDSKTITGLSTNIARDDILRQQAAAEAQGIQPLVDAAYAKGGIAAALDVVKNAPNTFGSDLGYNQASGLNMTAILGPSRSIASDKVAAYDSITQLLNSQTTDKSVQNANNQSEIDFLRTLPPDPAVTSKIVDLTNAIAGLTTSTDSLNATNQDLLSPYYTQDPRTSHIGFRSQGMASTGYIDIPGAPSANDNMTLTLPVASGERVNVGNGPNRGGGQSIVINMPVTIQGGANRDDIGRTLYQQGQNLARQLRAAAQ